MYSIKYELLYTHFKMKFRKDIHKMYFELRVAMVIKQSLSKLNLFSGMNFGKFGAGGQSFSSCPRKKGCHSAARIFKFCFICRTKGCHHGHAGLFY